MYRKMMKRKWILNLFTIILVLLLSSTLFACAKDDIHNLVAKSENVQLNLNGSIYIGNWITYDGKGKINYSVENTEVLLLEDDKVTGITTGIGKVVVSTEAETVSFTVVVVNPNEIRVEAKDTLAVYDGQVKNIDVNAINLPEGSVISYFHNGEVFSGATDPGEYLVNIVVTVPEAFEVNYVNSEATLTIDRATINMSKVKFASAIYNYDGIQKSIVISGTLPESVSVNYSNNAAIDAGIYKASAYFTVDTKYYYEIMPLSARLTINKISLDYSTLGFDDTTVPYNGEFQSIGFGILPQGLTVNYYLGAVMEENKIENISEQFKNVGVYQITALFEAEEGYTKNYYFENTATATFEIAKANFVNNLAWAQVPTAYTYDGNGITIGEGGSIIITGDTPSGVNGEYENEVTYSYHYKENTGFYTPITGENNTKTDAGTYVVAVKFVMPEGSDTSYNDLADMEFSFTINKAIYNTQDVTFTGENFTFDGNSRVYNVERPLAFDADVLIKYSINENDIGYTSEILTPYVIKDVGAYLIRASFTYKTENLLKNYLPINIKVITVNVNRLAVDLGTVAFVGGIFEYEADIAKSLAISGELPENIQVSYSENNSQINAGSYNITATFAYYHEGVAVVNNNYYFTQNSITVTNTKTATLIINKADYIGLELPSYHVAGGVYSPNKTLSDYVILDESNLDAANISWANPAVIPVVNPQNPYTAYYNTDPDNYNNHPVPLNIEISQATIDGNAISIDSQFLVRTGQTVKPLYTLNGNNDESGVLKLNISPTTPLIEWGTYPINVTFELADTSNYNFINVPESKAISIYIYNGSLYSYTGTQLTNYNGTTTVLSVLSGTTSIVNGAIKDKEFLSEIILPSSLVKSGISYGAINIANMPSLTTITLPFVGVNGYDTFGSIFGLTNANLPSQLQYVTVTDDNIIGSNVFKDCKYIKNITYNNDALSVGDSAFSGCNVLKYLTIGSEMTTLGEFAFRYCYELINLSLPFIGADILDTTSTISYLLGTNVGDNAYTNYFLSNLSITGNVTLLPDYAFAGLSKVGNINLPSTLTGIGIDAFSQVVASVNLNTNFTAITERTFYNYQGTTINIPSTVTSIGAYAFKNATKLVSLVIPKAVNAIGEYAFDGVTCGVSFEAETTITTIGANAFRNYKGSGIIIPDTVTTLGNFAFGGSSLTSIIIPLSVITLGDSVFEGCLGLTLVSLYNTAVATRMFYGCTSLTTISMTDSLTIIGTSAFENCTSLQSVLLKAGVINVGQYAFYGCVAMNSCEIRANTVISFSNNSFRTGDAMNIKVYNTHAYETAYPDTTYTFLAWES